MMGTSMESIAELDKKLSKIGCLLVLTTVLTLLTIFAWMLMVEARIGSLEEKVRIDHSTGASHEEEDQTELR